MRDLKVYSHFWLKSKDKFFNLLHSLLNVFLAYFLTFYIGNQSLLPSNFYSSLLTFITKKHLEGGPHPFVNKSLM